MPALPLTYDECRARFRHAASIAGRAVESHPLAARGPFGQELTIDVVRLGAGSPSRALVVLSGVHGVEGFAASAAQCRFVSELEDDSLAPDVAVVVVHVVNPWGMAHSRRQNESNVDLNRNWGRSDHEPAHNPAYDEIHPIACPDTEELPDSERMLAAVSALVRTRGTAWVRDAITAGQFRHPDGLHFGGDRTEESNVILERIVDEMVGVERMLVVDLHTGHGRYGDTTFLSSASPGSPEHDVLSTAFERLGTLQPTTERTASTGPKSGLISRGMAERSQAARRHAVVVEIGAADDIEQLSATYHEHWVYRRGDAEDADHRAARWRYRCCFTPEDTEWQRRAVESYGTTLDAALGAVDAWPT